MDNILNVSFIVDFSIIVFYTVGLNGETQLIDIRIHSSRHLEVKINYPIPTHNSYHKDIDYYIYSSPQLNVSSKVIKRDAMLRKFQAHARYTSPEITIDELLDPLNIISPLYLIGEYATQLLSNSNKVSDAIIIQEIQTLCNSIRHESNETLKECKDIIARGRASEVLSLLRQWGKETREVLKKYRAISSTVECQYPNGNKICSAFAWGDEAISLFVETTNIELFRIAQAYPLLQRDEYIFLITYAKEEAQYRKERNYVSVTTHSSSSNKEKIAYRSAELKKWTQSVLYLHPIESKSPKRVGGILAGTAAAIAMAFATFTAIFAEKVYSRNSMQWILLIILGYVFKDRIKESLRAFFTKIVPRLFSDQVFFFKAPRTNRRINKTKVVLRMKSASKMPPFIQRVREEGDSPFLDMLPEEDVIHYSRYVKIYKHEKKKVLGPWINSIAVVIRLRIDDWLKEMDDSEDHRYFIPGDEHEVEVQQESKVYHLHVIIVESGAKHKIEDLHHVKLVMNKNGIVRLEHIESSFTPDESPMS